MSLQSALDYIHRCRDGGPECTSALTAPVQSLEDLVREGRRVGLFFSIAQLRQAFRLDWQLRASALQRPDGSADAQ